MIETINQELVLKKKMEAFNFTIRFLRRILIVIPFLLMCSCDSGNYEDALNKSLLKSNIIFEREIMKFKRDFELKSTEEPIKYKADYDKIIYFENQIIEFNKLTSIEQKQKHILEMTNFINSNFNFESYISFTCLNVIKDEKVFNNLAKYDFNRILFDLYINIINRHISSNCW